MFQSLTGRLQTNRRQRRCNARRRFQSLTGRLQTVIYSGALVALITSFQSLTGRLQTLRRLCYPGVPLAVSIPHR